MNNLVDLLEYKKRKQNDGLDALSTGLNGLIERAMETMENATGSPPNWMLIPEGWYEDLELPGTGHPADLSCHCIIDPMDKNKWLTSYTGNWKIDGEGLLAGAAGGGKSEMFYVEHEDLVEDQSFMDKIKSFIERKIWNGEKSW